MVSKDGKALASASDDRAVILWELATRQQRHKLQGHTNSVRAVAFSSGGKTLASGGEDETIRLWEMATGQERSRFPGKLDTVYCVAFSPFGMVLAAGMADRTVLLWDVKLQAPEKRSQPLRLSRREQLALWADLASTDAGRAYRAMKKGTDEMILDLEKLARPRLRPTRPEGIRARGERVRER